MAAAVLLAFSVATTVPASAQGASRDFAAEEANRKLVVDFYERFFNDHDVAGTQGLVAESYKQHNPRVPDGKAPFVNFFTGFFKANPNVKAKIVRSAADGDLVWLHVHATNGPNDLGQAVVDIFRIENGKLVEHWDVIQSVDDKSANANTMF